MSTEFRPARLRLAAGGLWGNSSNRPEELASTDALTGISKQFAAFYRPAASRSLVKFRAQKQGTPNPGRMGAPGAGFRPWSPINGGRTPPGGRGTKNGPGTPRHPSREFRLPVPAAGREFYRRNGFHRRPPADTAAGSSVRRWSFSARCSRKTPSRQPWTLPCHAPSFSSSVHPSPSRPPTCFPRGQKDTGQGFSSSTTPQPTSILSLTAPSGIP